MKNKIFDEEMVLNEDFRAEVIEEIEDTENRSRKDEAKRRYDMMKDLTKDYVYAKLQEEFEGNANDSADGRTVLEDIKNRIANISFARAIIEKKAVVYKDGVQRVVVNKDGSINEEETEKAEKLYQMLRADFNLKKTNKIVEAQNNSAVYVMPYKDYLTNKYKYKLLPLHPHYFDAIEDSQNHEMARAIIFSYYETFNQTVNSVPESVAATHPYTRQPFRQGDNRDQIIADSPVDDGAEGKKYIWWTNKYHVTTDKTGKKVTNVNEKNDKNPFGRIIIIDVAKNQDGHYWALGGSDIFDGNVVLNLLLTDLYYIAKYQGFGYFYAFAKSLPENVKVGPREGITGTLEEGDPTPVVGFASPSSPLDQHMKMIEQYLAFLLSSRSLDPGIIKGELNAANAQSGIHEIVKRAENLDDIVNQHTIYKDTERDLYDVIRRVHNTYLGRNSLCEDFAEIGKLDENTKMVLKFQEPQVFTTEKEKLEIMKMRQELGIDSEIDTIQRDNPELTREESEEKFQKMLETKLMISRNKIMKVINNESNIQNESSDGDDKEGTEKGDPKEDN